MIQLYGWLIHYSLPWQPVTSDQGFHCYYGLCSLWGTRLGRRTSLAWSMWCIWILCEAGTPKIKARAFVMALTSLDPKMGLLADTIGLSVFKVCHLWFINTEILSGRNKNESVSIPVTKWKFSASGDFGLGDNGKQVKRTVFWSCWPLYSWNCFYTWLNFIRSKRKEIKVILRLMFSANMRQCFFKWSNFYRNVVIRQLLNNYY
jgi:hypothetical protein